MEARTALPLLLSGGDEELVVEGALLVAVCAIWGTLREAPISSALQKHSQNSYNK